MAEYKPLVLIAGRVTQLSSSDTLDAKVKETEGITLQNEELAAAISLGMATYISSGGKCKRAQADAAGTCKVIGLCAAAAGIAAGDSGLIQSGGQLVSADWTSVVGATTLAPNATYFLSNSAPGQLVTSAPTTGYVVEVGTAISATTMQIAIKSPIQL